MHVIFFGLKRAFHGTLRVTRRVLASLGLTPARFDMLYIVAKEGSSLLQRELQRALGVTAATVSRMLTSLEELGLVEREVSEDDHRCRNVVLTKAGRRRVLEAARVLIHSGNIQLAVDSALSPSRWYEPTACRLATDQLDRALYLLRHAYGDVATLRYPHADAKSGFARPLVWCEPPEAPFAPS
jgi:DNA-binding MarR family transcriptional regulator